MSAGSASGQRPGGSGAVLGFRLISLSGVQGVALVASNLLQLGTIAAVAGFLGAAALGSYSLLLFLGGLLTMVFSLAAKPGTIRRTFGGGDDDDDDDEDEEAIVSAHPKRSLGAGLLWAAALGLIASALVVVFRQPIADVLLGDDADADLVLWAGVLGGSGVLFKTASISLWFERRPSAFLIAEIARPLIALAVMIPLLAAGGELTDAIAGAAAGNVVAALLAMALLRGSFEPNLEPAEVLAIIKGGGRRVPIVSSIWIVQNADVFLLSRFVDSTDLGIYALAAKVGLVVSFFPQGFRVAMRPLRKSPAFKAVRSQYGRSVADGQILGYFVLVCISSVLVMVLLGQFLVDLAPPEFADAAPLIPLTAAGLTMPALWRTMHGQTAWPGKSRATFVIATMLAAATFVGICLLLAPEIGIYAAPVAMLVGFSIPITYFFVRCQLSENRLDFPYQEVGRATGVALLIGGGFHLLPELPAVAEALVIALLLGLYGAALFVLRVIPESHWPALTEMATSMLTGRPDRVNPRRGLRALQPTDRELLRVAVCERMPPEAFSEPAAVPITMLRPARKIRHEDEGTRGRPAGLGAARRRARGRLTGPAPRRVGRRQPRRVPLRRRAPGGSQRDDARATCRGRRPGRPAGPRGPGRAPGQDPARRLGGRRCRGEPVCPSAPGRGQTRQGRAVPSRPRDRQAHLGGRSSRTVVLVRAADDDLVGLDRDLELAVALPVLGVNRVGIDDRVEPEPEPLVLAVIEGRLEAGARALRASAPAPATPPAAAGTLARVAIAIPAVLAGVLAAFALALLVLRLVLFLFLLVLLFLFLFLFLLFLLGLHRRFDLGLDLIAEVDVVGGVLVGGEVVAADEVAELRGRDVQLVGDPGVGAALPDPGTDLVELRSHGFAGHSRRRVY